MPHVDSDEFSDNNTEIQPNKSNRKSKSKKKGMDPLISAAQTIARCVDFCCDIDKVIKTVQLVQQDEASKHGELDKDEAEGQVHKEALSQITPESREQMIRTYYKILQIVPSLKAIINDPSKCDELATICTKMNGHIKSVRSTDASHLKNSIPRYALPDTTKPNSLDPPIVTSSDRAEMGLNHPILARWLCLADQLEEFDQDPQKARKDLASGVIPMRAEDFPSLFWSGEMPGSDYDPDDMLHGLFRSYFLVRIGRHIFLGPSHAVEHDSCRGRSCNAVLHDMTTVQAEHIAYICIQARFGISSLGQWNEIDGNLNYLTMYRAIVHFIQDPIDTRWRDDLLKWWNVQMFNDEKGRQASSTTTTNGNSAPHMSTMKQMRAQVEARRRAVETSWRVNTFAELDPSPSSYAPPANDPPPLVAPTSSTQVLDPSLSSNAPPANDPLHPLVPLPSTQAPPSTVPTDPPMTPHRPSNGAPSMVRSPLTDEEELAQLPLTPVMNRRTTILKAKGKKRAVAPDEGEGGCAKRPKRTHK